MAWANLGRSKGKTAVTVLSLTLAVVLATMTYTFASGFDINKYLTRNADVDFILGDANYFNTSRGFKSSDDALPEEIIAEVAEKGGAGITESGRTYGQVNNIQQFVSEDWYRQSIGAWNPPEIVEQSVKEAVRNEEGLLMDRTSIYGMEDLPLDLLTVVEGDISALCDPNQNAIAAVLMENDYSEPYMDSHWAKVGDQVTLRNVKELEFYYPDYTQHQS
jgi:putative ABC transport system permease protein